MGTNIRKALTAVSLAAAAALGAAALARANDDALVALNALPETTRSPAQSSGLDSPAALQQAMRDAQMLASRGSHYAAAAVYFNVYTAGGALQTTALSHVAEQLIRAGFPNAASYFFIKTLESGDRSAIRRVIAHLPYMMEAVSGDLLRPYVLRHTNESDYDGKTRTHFYYFLGKDELLKGEPAKALQALGKVNSGAGILAQSAYLRGAAHAMLGQSQASINAFKSCASMASHAESRSKPLARESFDLEARCNAGLARAYYQSGQHDDAEEAYDDIPKASFVWTDVLFEQAWNAFAKGDYNRALGKLVTYRSPSLNFVFNPEVEVLRAQSFYAMCHYDDVETTVRDFEGRYSNVGVQMKNFLVTHDRDLAAFYRIAKEALHRKLHTNDMLMKALNRFVRGPYFAALVVQERATGSELARVNRLASSSGLARFSGFVQKVVTWRAKTVRLLGGLFVKNSMAGLYNDLLANVDKMSFIKLETLSHTKQRLEKKQIMSEDEDGALKRGSADISRKDYQYFWTFNGEFWADELGDYVFALESQCGG